MLVGRHDRVEGTERTLGWAEDPQLAADDRELDVLGGVDDLGLAGEPELAAQVGLRIRPRRQRLATLANLDDALPAAAGSTARCGHGRRDLVGVVEQRSADDERPTVDAVDDVRQRIGQGRAVERASPGAKTASSDYPTLVAVLQTLPSKRVTARRGPQPEVSEPTSRAGPVRNWGAA